MISNTLQQLFGANATQDSQSLVIRKGDLTRLTASLNNSAESLLVAILLQAWNEFEGLLVDDQGETLVDETGDAIAYDQRELYEKLHIWFWKRQFTGDRVLDTFVINSFVKPAPTFGTQLSANLL